VGATHGLRHDLIDHAELVQVLGRQLQGLGRRLATLLGAAPEDRGAALGRDHGIDGVLQHQHAVGGRQRDGAARAAFADDGGDQRDPELQAGLDAARDRLGLAARLGVDAGIGAGRVDQRDHRQMEAVCEVHQALGLAIALGPGHAEVVAHAGGGVGTLLVADDDDGAAAEAAEAADDGAVVGEGPVAGERRELLDQRADVVDRMGPIGVARHLRLLPGAELAVGLAQQPVGLLLQLGHLLGDVDVAAVGEMAQLLDLAFEFSDRLFEIEIGRHSP